MNKTKIIYLSFEENMNNFKTRLQNGGYSARIVKKHLSEIKFSDRKMSLAQKNKPHKRIYILCKAKLPGVA